MKFLSIKASLKVLLVSAVVGLVPAAFASGPDDDYVTVYSLIQKGDASAERGENSAALLSYAEAQNSLKRFQQNYPNWNPKVVNYRLRYLDGRLTQLASAPKPVTPAPAPTPAVPKPVVSTPAPEQPVTPPAAAPESAAQTAPEVAPAPSAPSASDEEKEIRSLQATIRQLQADQALMAAKLKEAFSAQPASADPAELARAKSNVVQLQKENELLKAGLEETKSKQNPVVSVEVAKAREALAETSRKLAQVTTENQTLKQENKDLQTEVKALTDVSPAASTEKLRKALDDSNKKVGELTTQNTSLQEEKAALLARLKAAATNQPDLAVSDKLEKSELALAEANRRIASLDSANISLSKEKESLLARLKAAAPADSRSEALLQENEILKKQLKELQSQPPAEAPASGEATLQLREARTRIAALQSDKEILQQEKASLMARLADVSARLPGGAVTPTTAPSQPAVVASAVTITPEMLDSVSAGRIARLEAERDELRKNLSAANEDISGRKKGREIELRIEDLTRQLSGMRARMKVLESQPVPYSPEELSLFGAPSHTLIASASASVSSSSTSARSSGKRPSEDLPASALAPLSEGQKYYLDHKYDKAEQKYLEVLRMDTNNVSTLTDLAQIQIDEGKWPEAEMHLKAALSSDPENDYALGVMGQLRLLQKNYDDALDNLSKAAQLNPHNARIQDHLGLALSNKGLRGQAETAFRKAIQLDPSYAEAHLNLAVVYVTQQPPLIELARWHYQQALAIGHAPKPELEKMLYENKPTASNP
jgi:Tfp pilus assembly protein PilF